MVVAIVSITCYAMLVTGLENCSCASPPDNFLIAWAGHSKEFRYFFFVAFGDMK